MAMRVCVGVCERERVSVYVSVSAYACLCVPSVSLCADSRHKITAAGDGDGVLSFAEFKAAYLKGQVDILNSQPATKLGARQARLVPGVPEFYPWDLRLVPGVPQFCTWDNWARRVKCADAAARLLYVFANVSVQPNTIKVQWVC